MTEEVKSETSSKDKSPETGRFLPGNLSWSRRKSWGAKPKYKDSEDLWNAACEYFQWVIDNPLLEKKLFAYEGEVIEADLPKMRAMTITGLCIYLGISQVTWYDWRKLRADLAEAIEMIEDVIYTQKFEGASAGLLNSNMISRDLGLVDKTEQVATVNLTVVAEDAEL